MTQNTRMNRLPGLLYVLLLLTTFGFPAMAADETLTPAQFNDKYEIIYNPVEECSEEFYYSVWNGTCKPYTNTPFVAYKGDHPDNIYYKSQRFDISGVTNLEQFKSINSNDARNRVIYDAVYDDPGYAGNDEIYCLDAQFAWADNFYAEGPSDPSFDGRIYIMHWAYTSATEGQAPNVVALGENPTEDGSLPVYYSNCEFGSNAKCGLKLNYSYTDNHPDRLCVPQSQHAGFMTQLVENDKDPLEYDQENMEKIVQRLGTTHAFAVGPISAGLYLFAEVALLITHYATNNDDDDDFYPVSLSYTWGALKRMTEHNISAWADSDVLGLRVWAMPDKEDLHQIYVADYYASSNCAVTFKANAMDHYEAADYQQHCWETSTIGGTKKFYSTPWRMDQTEERMRQYFYLPINWSNLAGHIHYRVKASKKTAGKSAPTPNAGAPGRSRKGLPDSGRALSGRDLAR